MPTGEYDVNAKEPAERRHFDRSFVQCAFAICLFIFLCVILLIISFAVRWRTSDKDVITDAPTTTPHYSGELSGKIKLSTTLKPTIKDDEEMARNKSTTTHSTKFVPRTTTTTAKTTTERKDIPLPDVPFTSTVPPRKELISSTSTTPESAVTRKPPLPIVPSEEGSTTDKVFEHSTTYKPLVGLLPSEERSTTEKESEHTTTHKPFVAPLPSEEGSTTKNELEYSTTYKPFVAPLPSDERSTTENELEHSTTHKPFVAPLPSEEGLTTENELGDSTTYKPFVAPLPSEERSTTENELEHSTTREPFVVLLPSKERSTTDNELEHSTTHKPFAASLPSEEGSTKESKLELSTTHRPLIPEVLPDGRSTTESEAELSSSYTSATTKLSAETPGDGSTTEDEPESTTSKPSSTDKTLVHIVASEVGSTTEKEAEPTTIESLVTSVDISATERESEPITREPLVTSNDGSTTEIEAEKFTSDYSVTLREDTTTEESASKARKESSSKLMELLTSSTISLSLTDEPITYFPSSETTEEGVYLTVPVITMESFPEEGEIDEVTETMTSPTTDFTESRESSSTNATTIESSTTPVTYSLTSEESKTSLMEKESSSELPEPTTAIPAMDLTTINSTLMPPVTKPNICNTPSCKNLAARMLVQMGHDHDPCDNFYMYACGRLQTDPFILEVDYTREIRDRIRQSIEKTDGDVPEAFRKFAAFYKSCQSAEDADVEEQFAYEIGTLLEGIGKFDVKAKAEDLDFTAFFMGIMKLHRPLLFDVIVDVDDRDSSRYILKMTIPIHENQFLVGDDTPESCMMDVKNGSNLNILYDEYTECKAEAIKGTIVEEFSAFLKALNLTGSTDHKAACFYMESWIPKLSKIPPPESKRRSDVLNKKYQLVKVSDLIEKYPLIDWKILLKGLFGDEIEDNTPVQLYADEYFRKVFRLMQDPSNKVEIFNGLLAAFVQQLYRDLVMNRRDKEYCLIVASRLMEDVAAAAYVQTFDKEELKSRKDIVNTVFEQLRDILYQQLFSSEWLDKYSLSSLIHELLNMTVADDGGEEVFGNLDFINKTMKGVELDESNYVRNSISLLRRYQDMIYKSYRQNPKDPSNIWTHISMPHDMHAVFVFGLNKLVVPYGKLTSPFFHKDHPKYLQLAGLGHVIAHEIAHHFDSVGVMNRTTGVSIDMLGSTARALYEKTDTCFTEKLGAPQVTQAEDSSLLSFKLDPEQFKDEQLADDIATALVYKLFNNMSYDTTEKQLPFLGLDNKKAFFLHLAQGFCTKDTLQSSTVSLFEDNHLPSILRVNHLISQSSDFVEAFGCPAKSKMNPEERCQVFPGLTKEELKTTEIPYSLITA